MFLSCITFFPWTLQAAQSEDEEEGEKIYYKGKFYSLSSNQPEIKVARDTWEEIISSRYNHQGNEDGSLSDSLYDTTFKTRDCRRMFWTLLTTGN